MDSKIIDQILDKYWEGETSLQEEAQLREYFAQDDVPAKYDSIKPMFQFFKQEQEAYLNGDFDERLSSKLKAVEKQEPKAKSLTFYIRRVAAIAAILVGVFFVTNKVYTSIDPPGVAMSDDEKKEAKLAYAEAKAALLLISKKLNKGTNKAESGIIQVRKATNVIKK